MPQIPMSIVRHERDREVHVVTINRPELRNAVDVPTAEALRRAFQDFDRKRRGGMAVLTEVGATFYTGTDLKGIVAGEQRKLTERAPGCLACAYL